MSTSQKPKVIPAPQTLPALGPLVIVEGECAYFGGSHKRATTTAFALPAQLEPLDYQRAMSLGMRRSGTLVYRPVCVGCRKCQPFRIDVNRFSDSRSQKRIRKRCDDMFKVELIRPLLDAEHLHLYRRYQHNQHNSDGEQPADVDSYKRFLIDSVADTWELAWRDPSGKLVAVGIVDVVEDGISTVYFYWEPTLHDLSLGVYSALWEIDLCRQWNKQYYYLGYLVRGAKTMSYKSQFGGGEVWDGGQWLAVPGRELDDPAVEEVLARAEAGSVVADRASFPLDGQGGRPRKF